MAKTVLEYVQNCLDTMDSDNVDSINDTEESLQVAAFLEDTYYELLNREEWKFLRGAAQLTGAGDTNNPTQFSIGGTIKKIEGDDCYVAYDISDTGDDANFRELTWCDPVTFVKRYSAGGADRQLVQFGTEISFYVDTNRPPQFYTSFDDVTIVCDAYDSDEEATLQTSKINVIAYIIPEFTRSDGFTPQIPIQMEPLLQAELNSVSHLWLRQSASAPDERRIIRQTAQARRAHSKTTSKTDYYRNRFGRK